MLGILKRLFRAQGASPSQSVGATAKVPGTSSDPAGTRTPPDAQFERKVVVTVTPAAAVKLREFHAAEPKPYLRVSIKGGGPTGFLYNMAFDDEVDVSADYLDVTHGFRVVVDRRSAMYLFGTKIDWHVLPDGTEGFHLDNPNAAKA